MADIRLTIPASVPFFNGTTGSSTSLTNIVDYYAVVTQAEEDGTVNSVMGYNDVITGTPGTIRVGVQSVDSSGLPSGTWIAYDDFAANTTNFPNFATFKKTLTNTGSVTRGQVIAIVFAAYSGTFDASNNIRFYYQNGSVLGEQSEMFPYMVTRSGGGAATKTTSTLNLTAAYGTSTRQFGFACSSSNISSWNNTATPDERAMKFVVPSGTFTSFKVAGVRLCCGLTNSAATWDLVLYDSSSSVLQSVSFTNSGIYNTTTIGNRDFFFDESTLSTLTPGSTYRIAIKPTSASLGAMQFNIAGSSWGMTAAFMPGGTWSYSTRTDAGSWTDDPNTTMPLKLIVFDATASGGGGGAIIPVGMLGGIRG